MLGAIVALLFLLLPLPSLLSFPIHKEEPRRNNNSSPHMFRLPSFSCCSTSNCTQLVEPQLSNLRSRLPAVL